LFAFRLAGRLGMTVRELLDRIDSAELTEWMAYARITGDLDPHFGPAIVAHTVAAVHGAKGSRVSDYYPVRPQAPQSGAEIKAGFETWLAGVAGRARNQSRPEGS